MIKNHKGYALFLDVENRPQRISNQAVVLTNIFEDNLEVSGALKGQYTTKHGIGLIMGYYNSIPKADRAAVTRRYKEVMEERGFVEVAA